MKKLTLSIAIALIALCNISTAQEVRLDSLWAKLGGVFAMTFSPDSKTLVIGEDGDEGQIRIFEAQTGREIDSIAHSDFVDMQYIPNGKQLMVIDRTSIKFYNSTTYKLERTIPYDNGGKIVFSPIESIICLVGGATMRIYDVAKEEVLAYLSRPDKYSIGPNKTEYYWNGKVCFSADGKYIIGKYENKLVQWDWQNAPTNPEILIGEIPNRAIIGFSPYKKYFVQQSNYLWDIQRKEQIGVEGIETVFNENNDGAAFTEDGKYLFYMNGKLQATIIDISKKKIVYGTERGAKEIAISKDNQYYCYRGVGNRVRTYRITWTPSLVENEAEFSPRISVRPLPGQEFIHIEVQVPFSYLHCHLSVVSSGGAIVEKIYEGNITVGKQTFVFPTTGISSGQYSVVMSYNGKTTSLPFIITK